MAETADKSQLETMRFLSSPETDPTIKINFDFRGIMIDESRWPSVEYMRSLSLTDKDALAVAKHMRYTADQPLFLVSP